ncbi:9719_t:CDS:2 [Diversispora eburnea]|uniref:9719_t:CDS:1 n=1 Tax=Diversispora eburnea TaxID=1213867 RepID=A0A9N8V5W6_9GLOM|nr:9719_t:CDS:2 [Diversispora eburnea]
MNRNLIFVFLLIALSVVSAVPHPLYKKSYPIASVSPDHNHCCPDDDPEQDKQNRENGLVNEEWENVFLKNYPLSPLGEDFGSFGKELKKELKENNEEGIATMMLPNTGMTITKSQWIFALFIRIDQLLTSNQMVILREMCRKCITIRKNLVIRKDLMKELFTVVTTMTSLNMIITIIRNYFGQQDFG